MMSSTAILEPPPYVWSMTDPCRSTSLSCRGKDLRDEGEMEGDGKGGSNGEDRER